LSILRTKYLTVYRHLLVILCLLITSSPAVYSVELKTVKLQLYWHHQFEFAGFYAAIEQGYFKQYGIEVELKPFDPKINIIETVINKEADLGITGIDLIQAFHQGKDLKLLASYFKRSPLVMLTQPHITSLKQLSGETVHGMDKLLASSSIREMLDLYNVDVSTIKSTMSGNAIELFKNNKVAGILTFVTDKPYELVQLEIPFKIFDPNQFGMVTQDLNLFTTAKFADENPELVKNFTEAANKGWQYALEHSDEVIALIKKKYNHQNKSIDALGFEASQTTKLILPHLYSIGSILNNDLELISEKMLLNKNVESLRDIDGLLINDAKEKAIDKNLLALLSAEEKKYLQEHPTITVQSEKDYPPFNYQKNGKPLGYSIDYIKIIAARLGMNVKFVKDKTWNEYIEMLKNKQLDVISNILETAERKKFAVFTEPYAELTNTVIAKKGAFNGNITKAKLINQRIVAIKGYASSDDLTDMYPFSSFVYVNNIEEALEAIIFDDADILFTNGVVAKYYIEKNFITKLESLYISDDLNYPDILLSLAVHKDNHLLAGILKKSTDSLPEYETIQLRSKWVNSKDGQNIRIAAFTEQELTFIKSEPVTLCRFNNSAGRDSSVQLIDVITRDTGLKINLSESRSWSESLNGLKNKTCDLLLYATETNERKKVMNFTPAYTRQKRKILTKKELAPISDLSDHLEKTFAVTKGDVIIELLNKEYPNINLVIVNKALDGASLVEQGVAFGYIALDYSLHRLLINNDFNNLKINATLREKFDDLNSIATRKEDKILNSILSKAVNSSDKQEIKSIIDISTDSTKSKIDFTLEEQAILINRSIVWCFSDNSDGWNEIMPSLTKDININLTRSKKMPWADALKALADEECDVLPKATETDERKKTMLFTPPLYQEQRVIVTDDKQPFIANFEDHLDKKFTALKGNHLITQLKSEYPEIRIILVDRLIEGLHLVQNKDVFAYLGSLSDVGNVIHTYSLKGIKIAGTLPDRFNDKWPFALRKDDKTLANIFTKLTQNADKKEIRRVLTYQFSVKYENAFDYKLFWQFLSATLVILIAIIFWNRRLAKLNAQLETAKRTAEQAQLTASEAHKTIIIQEKMASLGTLTAGVAHEINNPVNFTYAAIYMMKEEISKIKAFLKQLAGGDKADEAVLQSFEQEFAKLIELTETATHGSNRIKTIVNDLQAFSRLDSTQQTEAKLGKIIASTIHLVKTQYHDINININIHADPTIFCFPAKLNQVFMNIAVNACQAIETRKSANDQHEGQINISLQEKAQQLLITFEDNGCGMTDKTLSKIFDPFFTTKEVGSGTGLGMAISFGIIEDHVGNIDIESSVDNGSKLTITLPINQEIQE